jgi:predicted ATPase with chaperone activity
MKELFTMSDNDLAALLHMARIEQYRRGSKLLADTGKGNDPAAVIKGQEHCKRIITVAVCGFHTICFFGPRDSGKTMLRALAYAIKDDLPTFEARCCPCGNWTDTRQDCKCTPKQIEKQMKALPLAEIYCEVSPVPFRELDDPNRGTTLAMLQEAIQRAKVTAARTECLDKAANELLRHATAEMPLTAAEVQTCRKVASTISALDRADIITSAHLCEAVNYVRRPVYRSYR